jgi:triosephosphate isomerase
MHKTAGEAVKLTREMLPALEEFSSVDNVICPPFTALAPLSDLLQGMKVKLGAQNLYWEDQGAYTGEISPNMVAELAEYVIIGHSERRAYFGETDQSVNKRLQAALNTGLSPIFCIGETLEENEAGKTREIVTRQLKEGMDGLDFSKADDFMVAYEPVWAIGTGKAATPEGANQVILEIRNELAEILSAAEAEQIRILYGGSVKPANAASFFSQSDIDGALVGGASLRADDFAAITEAAES